MRAPPPSAALFILYLTVATSGCDGDGARERTAQVARVSSGPQDFAARCAGLPDAAPSVTAQPIDVRFDETRSLAELTALYARAAPHHATLGLTHAQLAYATSLVANGLRQGREVCMRVRVQVEVSLAPMIVYIAREIATDPCRREAVREHELRHVEEHAAFLREAPERLHSVLAAAHVDRVRTASDAETIQADAAREVRAIVAAAEATDRSLLAARQAAVDTPEAYAGVGSGCAPMPLDPRADGGRDSPDRR